jgi:hypothetical protein
MSMTRAFQGTAIALVVALLVAAVPPIAVAQQPPPPPPAGQTPPPPPGGQSDIFRETMKVRAPHRGPDGYDSLAVVMSVLRPPFKVLLCSLGIVVGTGIFIATFGNEARGAAAAMAEGCGGKWYVSGDDLRPESGPDIHKYDWE